MAFLNGRWWLAAIISSACVFAVSAWLLVIGPTHVVIAPWDVFINLDEAWRLHLGQVPGRDFHNPVGPVTYLLDAYGMDLVGPSLDAVTVGNVIFLCIVAAMGSFVAYRRIPPLPAMLFVVFLVFMIGATRQMGRSVHTPGYCELYNRYGWSLLCVVFLQFCLPVRKGAPERRVVEGVLGGTGLAILFYTKATFAAVAAIPVLFACCACPQWRQWRRLAGFMAGLLAVGMLLWLLIRLNVYDYLKDFIESGRAQTFERRWPSVQVAVIGAGRYVLLTGIVWAFLVAVPVVRRRLSLSAAVGTSAFVVLAAACAVLAASGNTGEAGEMPLFVIPGLIVINASRWQEGGMPSWSDSKRDWSYLAAVVVVLVIAGPTLARDALSIAVSTAWRGYRTTAVPASQRFDAKPIGDFIIPHNIDWTTNIWTSAQLPGRVNDGLALVRRHVSPQQSVLALAFSNPFTYALGLRPPRGTPVWFDFDINFNRRNHMDPERLFADVDFVIEPVLRAGDVYVNGKATLDALHDIYEPYLAQQYVEVERSTYWRLRRRRSLSSGSPD